MDIKNNPQTAVFLFDLIEKSREHKIRLVFEPEKVEFAPGSQCSGLFDSDNMELTLDINKPIDEWLPVLVHESCHLDQFVENCQVWKDCDIKGHDTGTILDMWLSDVIDLNPDKLKTVLDKTINMELDCEKRAVEKIKKFKLPLSVEDYIKKSNAYMYFYRAMGITRKWSVPTKGPYKNKEVWSKMPSQFLNSAEDYKSTDNMVDIIVKNCF